MEEFSKSCANVVYIIDANESANSVMPTVVTFMQKWVS